MARDNLKQRIEELERRIRELEARPVYVPVPVQPQPYSPVWPTYPVITYSGVSGRVPVDYQVWN